MTWPHVAICAVPRVSKTPKTLEDVRSTTKTDIYRHRARATGRRVATMRSMRKLITIATATIGGLALGAVGGLGGTAGAAPPPSSAGPVAVTGTTPFPGCTAGGTPSSTVFTG